MDLLNITQTLAYIALYAITGFGPGVMFGIIVGNIVGAKGKNSISENYQKNIKVAATHNAQWHPTHKKWEDSHKP